MIGCAVLAHRGPGQVAQLVAALRDPELRVYLHVDSRVPIEPFTDALVTAGVGDTPHLRRRATRWGGREVVEATLDAIRTALDEGCRHFALISGQDFPLRPPGEIAAFFAERPDTSFVEYWALPHAPWRFEGRDRTDFYTYTVRGRRETCIPRGEDMSGWNWKGRALNLALRTRTLFKPKRRFPSYLRPYAGFQWLNLSRAAAEFVVQFVDQHPDYLRYHEHTILPDELFFQSILLGSGFADDHEVVNDALRFMDWSERGSHPRTLTSDDLPALRASDALFARKFDADVDADVLTELSRSLTV